MKRWILFLVLACLQFCSGAADAQANKSFWIEPLGGVSTYAMTDVNDEIADLSALTGLHMDEISSGYAYGIRAGTNVSPRIALSASYERLSGSSEIGDYSGSIEYNLPANVFYGACEYSFPSLSAFHMALAGGLGLVSAAGEINLSVTGEGAASGKVTGTGALFEGLLVAHYTILPNVTINPSVGYRFAKVGETKVEDEIVYNADGSKYTLDYGGLVFRIGLRVFL